MNSSIIRTWAFRILAVAVAGLIVASFFVPWWTLNVTIDPDSGALPQPPNAVRIYAYGLRSNLTQDEYLAEPFVTPPDQSALAFVFLGVTVALILVSTWVKGTKAKWLLGLIGLSYIGYALGFLLILSNGVKKLGYPMQGKFLIHFSIVTTTLKPMYFDAYAAGLALILLALLRDIIAPALRSQKEKA
jgi:hypothetical protein